MKYNRLISTLAFTAFVVLVLSSQAFAFFGLGSRYEAIEARDGLVMIPISEVNDGDAHYYSFEAKGREIRFFVLKSADGVIRAAFDACDVCYKERKGYDRAGETVVCNNCGQSFHSTMINEVKGGCNPAPLARKAEDGTLFIRASDIEQGARYF
jgi:uncharacterized membrane protein